MKTRKTQRQWWDDEDDYYKSKYGDIYGDDYGVQQSVVPSVASKYKYKPYFYKKSFDFSVGLETRVRQLIKTISGNDLKLAKANGWGADKDYFYYNPDDLTDATDDEVLGLIFHQLARELFINSSLLKKMQKAEPKYRHLLDALEDNRVDLPMVDKYNGADYYLGTVWESLKKEGTKPKQSLSMFDGIPQNPIPAMEFIYNVSAVAHNQAEYSGFDTKALQGFLKAIPAIQKYLASPTMAEAMKHYPEIKKHYPIPDDQEEQKMDNQMTGMNLSENEKKSAHREAKSESTKENGLDMDSKTNGFQAGDTEQDKLMNHDYAEYQRAVTQNQSTINSLHKLLASILSDNDNKRFIGRQKRGKIDGKSLHKLVTQGSDRIFKREQERQGKKYAFTLLVDQSGSMSGDRIDNAFAGTVILTEVFGRLRIPLQIVGFDYYTRNYKKFFNTARKEVIGGIYQARGGGTHDAHAVGKVYELNKALPQGYNRSVFVLTDGEGQYGRTHELVNDMMTKDKIKVFGLGMGNVSENSLRETYPNYALCEDVTELPSIIINLVREQFKRS